MTIQGLHHITLVCSNPQRTVNFYTRALGLRLVKKTVNYDDPSSYHLYLGNATGAPGSVITFFGLGQAPQGRPGIGGTHHVALRVPSYDALLKWKRRLVDFQVNVDGPYDRKYFSAIYFKDLDGGIIELATDDPGLAVDERLEQLGMTYQTPPDKLLASNRDEGHIRNEMWPDRVADITPDMALNQGLRHVTAICSNMPRTHQFLSDTLGLRLVKQTSNFDRPDAAHWTWGVGNGEPGTLISYFANSWAGARRVQRGLGQTHHFAFSVADEDTQLAWRDKLLSAGVRVSPVMDRLYFKSIYFNDPDGHILEIATAGPGFTVDEPAGTMGRDLKLPPWLESSRASIEQRLSPVVTPAWKG